MPRLPDNIRKKSHRDKRGRVHTYYYFVYTDKLSHKRVWVPVHGDLAAVRRQLPELTSRVARGDRLLANARMNEVWEDFIQHKEEVRGLKPSTIAEYRSAWNAHLSESFGDRKLRSITPDMVEAFVREIRKATYTRAGKQHPYSPKRINNLLLILKSFFAFARTKGYVLNDPTLTVKPLPVEQPDPRFLTPQQAECLIRNTPEEHQAFIITALHTGLRLGEIRALTWRRVSFDRRVVKVVQSMSRDVVGPPKSRNSKRSVVMDDLLYETLMKHRARQRPSSQSALVFPGPNGGHLDPNNFRKWVFNRSKVRASAELKKRHLDPLPTGLTFHDLRHTYASWLVSRGVSLYKVMKLLGHSDYKMAELYSDLLPDAFEDALAALNSVSPVEEKRRLRGAA